MPNRTRRRCPGMQTRRSLAHSSPGVGVREPSFGIRACEILRRRRTRPRFNAIRTVTALKVQDELTRQACMPSILGRLARRGEDAELQQGDAGEEGPAGL